MPQDRISVTVLTGPEIMARITARQWRSLAQRVSDSPYFLQYEMASGYLNHLRAEQRGRAGRADPLALLLKRNGAVVGVILLERDTITVSGLRLPALSLVVHPHAPQSDLLLVKEENLVTFWPEIIAALSAHDVRWEAIRFPAARTSSAAWRETCSIALKSRVIAHPVGYADYFDCVHGHEKLEAAYGTSLRRRLGQANRQLARTGRIAYSCFRSGSEGSAEAFEKFLKLESAGWKGTQGTAIAQSVALKAHYEQFYAMDTPAAWAEVHLMTLDDEVIAAQFCIVSGGIREVVKLAYDETMRKQSPGNVMLDHMLKISCEDPRISSFGLVGRPPWLAEWSPSSHEVHDVWLFRRRAIARLGVLSSTLKRSAVEFLRERLRRTGKDGGHDAIESAGSVPATATAPAASGKPTQQAHPKAKPSSFVPMAPAAAPVAVVTSSAGTQAMTITPMTPASQQIRMPRNRTPRPPPPRRDAKRDAGIVVDAEPLSRPVDLDPARPTLY